MSNFLYSFMPSSCLAKPLTMKDYRLRTLNNHWIITTMTGKQQQKGKKEVIIELTDFSGMNRNTAVRDPKPRSRLDLKTDYLGGFDSSGIEVIPEDRGYSYSKQQRPQPVDPESGYDERLEADLRL